MSVLFQPLTFSGEHRLRDVNDAINKLIREKSHWEKRIVELGGPNYAKMAPKEMDGQGNESVRPRFIPPPPRERRGQASSQGHSLQRSTVSALILDSFNCSPSPHLVSPAAHVSLISVITRPSTPPRPRPQGMESQRGAGYKYFGAAKALPGVKELFESHGPRTVRRTRHQMNKAIDADYYGFRDEEDGVLDKVERAAEAAMREAAEREYEGKEEERSAARGAGGKGLDGTGASERASERVSGSLFLRLGALAVRVWAHHSFVPAVPHTPALRCAALRWAAFTRHPSLLSPLPSHPLLSAAHRGSDEVGAAGAPEFVAHVPLPDSAVIETMVMAKKKRDLLEKYASPELIAKEAEAKELLNKKPRTAA